MSTLYETKKNQIKKAAIQIFARYGYHKTTLDDIANNIGMKKNSLYYYFLNKEELFNELVKDEFEIISKEIDKSVNALSQTSQKVKSLLRKLITHGKERSKIYSVSFDIYLEIGEVIEKSHNEQRSIIIEKLEHILKAGIKSGELKKHNCRELSEYLIYMTSAMEHKELRRSGIQSFDQFDLSALEKMIIKLVDYILAGLRCKK